MSLNDSLERYTGLLLSSRYAAEVTDFKIRRPGNSDLNFTMLASHDDFDTNPRKGRDAEELRNAVVAFVPPTYTINGIENNLVPDSSLFMLVKGKWHRWESTMESDGAGFMLTFVAVDLNVAAYQTNRR